MTGKELTPAHKAALLSGIRRDKQTRPERAIAELTRFMFAPHEVFRYSGDGKFWIRLKGGRVRNPDFTNRQQRQVIEVFGRYWHKPAEEAVTITEYAGAGWQCLVIWDDDININTRDSIMQFAFPYEYEEELREGRMQ